MKKLNHKRTELLSYIAKDPFFERLSHNLIDFGCNIRFSLFTGTGAYHPLALATERLDTPEKQQNFTHGFWNTLEKGNMKSTITLPLLSNISTNAHTFLHETMHFYQDMHGLYFLPLQEQGIFPVMLDVHSTITIILFNEAWAQTETIRTAWALKRKGDARGWDGALKSKDWASLAQKYDQDLQTGIDEAKAAADTFKRWYKGKHRAFYEHHSLHIYNSNYDRYSYSITEKERGIDKFRHLKLPEALTYIPKDEIPIYFNQIDWTDSLYTSIKTTDISNKISQNNTRFPHADNTNLLDIKNGAPPYLWYKLRAREIAHADIPAQMLQNNDE